VRGCAIVSRLGPPGRRMILHSVIIPKATC